MTREGKCDVCRRRKVKCDEIHPQCGACRKGNRECTYTYGKANAFVDCHPKPRRNARDGSSSSGSTLSDDSCDLMESHAGADATKQAPSSLTLRLRSSNKTKCGTGVFQKFVPVTTDSLKPTAGKTQRHNDTKTGPVIPVRRVEPIARQITPAGESLIRRYLSFVQVICPGLKQPYLLGEWTETTIQVIGRGGTADYAMTYFLDSSVSWINPSEQNATQTEKSNAVALGHIRNALSHGSAQSTQDGDALLAVSLIRSAEVFMGIKDQKYKIHEQGLLDLFIAITKGGAHYSDSSLKMFHTVASAEQWSAILAGRDSVFDKPIWYGLPVPEIQDPIYASPELVQKYITDFHIKFPRLVRLVREARHFPEDEALRLRATELATCMYLNDLEIWVTGLKSMGLVWCTPTLIPEYDADVGESYDFACVRVFKALATYWMTRNVICGCILALNDITPSMVLSSQIDPTSAAVQDILTAENIARCVQYTMSAPSPIPLTITLLWSPLMRSFGTWHRLERRAGGISAVNPDAQQARRMKSWVLDRVVEMVSKWTGPHITTGFLEWMSNTLMGGPLRGGQQE